MTPEERQLLVGLFERVNAVGATPRDSQAEAFINDAVRAAPFSPYVLAQTVLVQQQALEAAARRVAELEAAATRAAAQPQPEQGGFLGNLGRSIFGGPTPPPPGRDYDPRYQQQPPEAPAYQPPPPSGYAPQRPGPWGGGGPAPQQAGGGGFLQNAMSTAAGVAGGVAIGSLLGGLFSGHSGGGLFGGPANASLLGGGGAPGGGAETINIFESAPGRADPGKDDSGQFDPNMPDDAGFLDDSSFDDGGGYDDV